MTRIFRLFLFSLLGLTLFFSSCRKDEEVINISSELTSYYDGKIALQWWDLITEIDRYSPGYRPPAASRAFAYIGLAGYESVVAGMPDHKSLRSAFIGLNLPSVDPNSVYHWPTSFNAAYATIIKKFYPHIRHSDLAKISWLENSFDDTFLAEVGLEVFNQSKSYGTKVADAVFEYSRTDVHGNEAYRDPRPSSYIPPTTGPNGEKLWQPTPPDYSLALFPYWGKVRPFAMKESDLVAKPPLPYSENPNSKFYQQALETKVWVDNLTYEDKWIAEFWSDDFYAVTFQPSGRQMAIANQIVEIENPGLDFVAELYAKLGMAMADAAIAIWNSKYLYNVLRPLQYIREFIDPGFVTILNHPLTGDKSMNPEFPAYPSGHSGFGSSASGVLANMFGDNYAFTDNCHINRTEFLGTPRSYTSFYEAAIENAYSRLPLGVHFRMDCDEGVRMGFLAANRVVNLPWRK